ncbi:hypothetical protein DEJ34_03215 [Curtobacterium sp. MCPF17_050]|uniref:hypothetical protein n=1 Tax=Curtobacterium sp. MCPF17_050 TaxID=2175664 RepID=UPI000D960E23|nr:hypothetical protein [Curtobacterium sp. MCPF17_050]WIB16160.1 hypothetical protein DEJ34_03215 [Curtobacterium sp. MCPF17_050]
MTIDDLVTRRWAAADEDAERVLAHEQSLLRVTPWTRWSLGLGLAALLAAIAGFVLLPRGEDDVAHLVVGMVLVGAAVVSVVVRLVVAARSRRVVGTAFPTVTTVLSAQERHAVARAVDGRVRAPEDRLRIVRAAAVLRAAPHRIEEMTWYSLLWAALALGSSSAAPVGGALYCVAAVLSAGAAVYAGLDVARVRRALRSSPTPWEAAAERP